ncbi:hypothetical protein G9A89_021230 [Geosiphon pyriformis]|nr:hypothetical protein G9A89_021230 [Geosiphon pyriformis]
MSDDNNGLILSSSVILESNELLPIKLCVIEKWSFNLSKFFALDIELLAVPGKTFSRIIRSSFISELSLKKAKNLAVYEKIVVNVDVKQVNKLSDWVIVVKEIPVNLSKLAVESVFSKFGKITSIKMHLITLLYTFPIGTIAHDLSDLLESYGGKTCFIGRNPISYVHDRCAIVCFVDKTSKLAAIGSIPMFKGINLCWAGFFLACCAHCKQFGHISTECLLGRDSGTCVLIVCPVFFGRKTWAQVAGGSSFHEILSKSSGVGLSSGAKPVSLVSESLGNSCLAECLAFLECSLELLVDQVLDILKKLSFVKLVPLASSFHVSYPVVVASVITNMDSDMTCDDMMVFSPPLFSAVANLVVDLSSSSSKVLTTKVGGLESKMVALEMSVESVLERLDCLCLGLVILSEKLRRADVIQWHKDMNNLVSIFTEMKLRGKIRPWIVNKFNGIQVFTSGLNSGYIGSGIAIAMNNFLAKHVYKVFEVPGWLLSIKLLFKNKLFVSILGLYVGASALVWFFQASEINSFIAKTVNESSFFVLDSNFNENRSRKCASFKKCFDLDLINSLNRSPAMKTPTWCNFYGVSKMIDYVLVFSNLVNAVVDCNMANIMDHFDTDHMAVSVSVGLGGLFDDHWKFDVKNTSDAKRCEFSVFTVANTALFLDDFSSASHGFLNKWNIQKKVVQGVSSRFYKLELLVSKLVKALYSNRLNSAGASAVKSLFLSDFNFDIIYSALAKARKLYCSTKLLEFRCAKESSIKQAINKRMESFELNKDHTIRSVLEHPFCKVVLDYLVLNNELVLELELVKFKTHQYQLLDYVFDGVFSNIMSSIGFDEMFAVVSNLLNGKAAGLSGISNEL